MRRIEKQRAIQLRLRGRSYNEIRKILRIPSKGTLSYWFRGMKLPQAAKLRLAGKMRMAQERGLLNFNKKRTKIILAENQKERTVSSRLIDKLSERELLLIGAALYWGEGYKSGKAPRMVLTNSDPGLARLFMRFVREVLNVPDADIRTHISVHPNVNKKQAVLFWAQITNLPPSNFRVFNQVSRAGKGRRPKRSLPYGTLDIRVHKRILFFKMMGLIDGLTEAGKHMSIHA